jgi:hypothetical protein
MQKQALKELLNSIIKFNEAKDGDSEDAELDAAVEMRDAAFSYILASTARDIDLSEMVDEYKALLEEQEES